MSEIIKIKNLGPILNAEIELRKVNIFIGDQGTGKSTLAKVIVSIQNTFFRDLLSLELHDNTNKETQLFIEYLKFVDIINFLQPNTEIFYEHPVFYFEYKDSTVRIKEKLELSFQENLRYDLNYIPAERSSITLLSNSLYALIETGTSLPRLFLRFGDKFLKSRKENTILDYSKIIGVKFSYNNNEELIELDTGKKIKFSESSSGIQSSLTLLAVYDNIVNNSSSYRNVILSEKFLAPIIIEEPEISCFPNTQFKILNHIISNLIIRTVDRIVYANQLIITTHSPYILTSMNNMIYGYKVGQINPGETAKVVEEKSWINPDDISVYMMLTNGECEDIFDREEGLIKAEKIDGVTNILNNQFSELLNLEFAAHESDSQ